MIQKLIGSVFTLIGGVLFLKFALNIISSNSKFNIGFAIGYLAVPGLILFLGLFILTRKSK